MMRVRDTLIWIHNTFMRSQTPIAHLAPHFQNLGRRLFSRKGEAFGGAAMSRPRYKPEDGVSGASPSGLIGPGLYERFRSGLKFALFSVAVVALLLAAGWHYAFH